MFDNAPCKQIVTVKHEERHCKREVTKDGYCAMHHPQAIETKLQKSFNQRMLTALESKVEKEEVLVGGYLRKYYPKAFNRLLSKVAIKALHKGMFY